MKYFSSSAALLLVLVPAGFAQSVIERRDHWFDYVPRPHITYVETTPAPDPGAVEVLGYDLDLITGARVNGVEVPILANDGWRIVVTPPAQNPGFGLLELVMPAAVHKAKIEFTPSLAAHWNGGLVQLRLNPGHGGWYIINYSFKPLDEMIAFPGSYYGQMLDLESPYSGVIFSGTSTPEPMLFPYFQVPRGLQGPGAFASARPMRIQALCGGSDLCYSNMVTLQPTL